MSMKKSATVMAPETVEEAHSIIKAQLNQIKLLAAESDYKSQQLNSQKEKIIELEKGIVIYKQQVTNLETKLRLYDQELKLKMNTLIDKNNKLVQQNQYLMSQGQAIVIQNKQLQEQKIYAENEINRLAIEGDQIKQKHMFSEDAFYREQERSRIKEDEIETLEDTMHQLTAENQELKRRIDQLTRNFEEQMLVLNEKDAYIHKLTEFETQNKDIRQNIERDEFLLRKSTTPSSNREYEVLKQRYDNLVADYQELVLDMSSKDKKGGDDGYFRTELHNVRVALEEKTREVARLTDILQQFDLKFTENSFNFESHIKKSIQLIDGETTQILDRIDNMAINLLNENIIRQNREFLKLQEKIRTLNHENKDLRSHMSTLCEEGINLKSLYEQKERAYELLNGKYAAQKEEHIKDLKFSVEKYEEKMKEQSNVSLKIESTLKEELRVAESLNAEYQSEIRRLNEKLSWVDEERTRAVDFLQEQNIEISDFKERYFILAEDASKQKAITKQYAYVFAYAIKLLFAFLKRFETVVKQKHFIYQYFYHYLNLKERLIELNFIEAPTQSKKKSNPIYKKFRKVGYAVMAANRLRFNENIGQRYEDYDARNNLQNIPEGLKRILLNLFRYDNFEFKEGMLSSFEDLLARDNFDERSVLSHMIVVATQYNQSDYDPDKYYNELRKLERNQIEQINKTFNMRNEFQTKLDNLDNKLRAAEDYILSQEKNFKQDMINNYQKIEHLTSENSTLSQINEELENQYSLSKKQVDELMSVISKNSVFLNQSNKTNENLNERYNTLQNEILSIVRYKDFLEKEIEQKNLRIMEYEAKLIRSNQKENTPIEFHDTKDLSFSDKKPGQIYRSSTKKGGLGTSFHY